MKKIAPDILAVKACVRGLNNSTSRKTLEANLRYLWDRYLAHPSPELPQRLKPFIDVPGTSEDQSMTNAD